MRKTKTIQQTKKSWQKREKMKMSNVKNRENQKLNKE
jgi:hypothetical protein